MRNQHELHEVEGRCTEEDPPACSAGCPLGVDVRSFNLAMQKKDFSKAWKLLEKSMPLPQLTIRLCEAPCERFCVRKELGGSVAISQLEKLCLQNAPAPARIRPLPSKGKSVRCLGAGLASLTCAWELAKKGCSVEVVSTGLSLPESLPQEVVEAEITRLESLKVQFRTVESLGDAEFASDAIDAIDALFIDRDAVSDAPLDLTADPFTRQCSEPHLFTGGGESDSPHITAISDGRQAAISIDRFLQNANLTTGRHPLRHGETGLSPELDGVTPLPPVQAAAAAYTAEEGAAEAARCLDCHCLRCVRACVYLQEYGDFPRKHARAIFNNFSIYQGVHGAYSLIDSCALCDQCKEICPTDFSMADICLDARQRLVDDGDIPPNAHYFALQEMHHAMEETALLRHAPGQSASTAIFYPGCQLAAIRPQQVWALYQRLLEENPQTGIWLDCCGAPAHWAGRKEEATQISDSTRQRLAEMGDGTGPKLITACASCLQRFREAGNIEVESVWNLLADAGTQLTATDTPLALSDPCSARHDEQTMGSVRSLLAAGKQQLAPLAASGSTTECCGFGGLMENANPKLAQKVIEARVQQSEAPFLTWCAMCRDRLAKTGHPVYHLLDLLFPETAIAASTPPATISERRFNRQGLKSRLLTELYHEEPAAAQPWSAIKLEIAPEVAAELDAHRVLEDDLRRTLAETEESGAFFAHSDGRRRASARLGEVTFWVEYRLKGEVYEILHGWSHRMNLKREE